MKYTSFAFSVLFLTLLSSCSFSLPKGVGSTSPAVSDVPPLTATEVALLTPDTMQIMDETADTSNVLYINMDTDSDKEAVIIFNRYGCTEGDKARLYVLKYNREKQAWYTLDMFVLAGKQGLIHSFQKTPEDITGDGNIDLEIYSETIGCGEPWTVYTQVFTLENGALVDLTGAQLSSVEGGLDAIQRQGKTYEVYTSLGQSNACNPYNLTLYTFDGKAFSAQTPSTTQYRYKIVEKIVTDTPREDQFLNGCITTDSADRFFEYVRNDALNHTYPAFVPVESSF